MISDPVADAKAARAAYLEAVIAQTGHTEVDAWRLIGLDALDTADAIDAAWVDKHVPPSPDVIAKTLHAMGDRVHDNLMSNNAIYNVLMRGKR